MYQIQTALAVLVLMVTVVNTLSWLTKPTTPYLQFPQSGLGKRLLTAEAIILSILALLYLLGFVLGNAMILLGCVFSISSFVYSIIRRSGRSQSS